LHQKQAPGHQSPPHHLGKSKFLSILVYVFTHNIQFHSLSQLTAVKALEEAFKDVTTFDSDSLLLYGLAIFGFSAERQAGVSHNENVLRFKANYGADPDTVAPFLTDVKARFPDKFRAKHALMTLNWLKCYGTERTMSGPWQEGCEKSLRNTVKKYTRYFSSLKESKIVFGGFEDGDIYPYTVDGVHFGTRKFDEWSSFNLIEIYSPPFPDEFRLNPCSKWFDHKSNGAGLKYEVASFASPRYCLDPRTISSISVRHNNLQRRQIRRARGRLGQKLLVLCNKSTGRSFQRHRRWRVYWRAGYSLDVTGGNVS
jgi:hypothetical protein